MMDGNLYMRSFMYFLMAAFLFQSFKAEAEAVKFNWAVKGAFTSWSVSSNTKGKMNCKKQTNGGVDTWVCSLDEERSYGSPSDGMLWESPKLILQFSKGDGDRVMGFNITLKADRNEGRIIDEAYIYVKNGKFEFVLGNTYGADGRVNIQGTDANYGSWIGGVFKKAIYSYEDSFTGHSFKSDAFKANKAMVVYSPNENTQIALGFTPNTSHAGAGNLFMKKHLEKKECFTTSHLSTAIRTKFKLGKGFLSTSVAGVYGNGRLSNNKDGWKAKRPKGYSLGLNYQINEWMASFNFTENAKTLQIVPSGVNYELADLGESFMTASIGPQGNEKVAYYNPNKANAGRHFVMSMGRKFEKGFLKDWAVYGGFLYGIRKTGFSWQRDGVVTKSKSFVPSFGVTYTVPYERFAGLGFFAEIIRPRFKNEHALYEAHMNAVLNNKSDFSAAYGNDKGKIKSTALILGIRMNLSNGS